MRSQPPAVPGSGAADGLEPAFSATKTSISTETTTKTSISTETSTKTSISTESSTKTFTSIEIT